MRPKRALQERRKSGALSERYNCKPPQIVTRRPLDKATHSRWPSAGERGPRRCRENSFRQGQIRPVQSVPCTWSTARDAFLCPAWVLLSSPECRNAPRKRYHRLGTRRPRPIADLTEKLFVKVPALSPPRKGIASVGTRGKCAREGGHWCAPAPSVPGKPADRKFPRPSEP